MHSYLKALFQKIISNHATNWDSIPYTVAMTYMPTLFKLLMPRIRYMGDENCCIHLDSMRKIYMMTVLDLKTARDKCPPKTIDSHENDFKVEDMVLLKNHTPTTAFDVKYKTSYQTCKHLSKKAFDIQDTNL